MRKFSLIVGALAFGSMALIGCGGDGTKTVNVGDTKFTSSDALPASFPKDFPIYGGAHFKGSISTTRQGKQGSAATWATGDSLDKVKSFYNDQFGGQSAWTQDSATDTEAGSFYAFQRTSDSAMAGFLTIAKQGDTTSVMVFLGDKLNAENDTPTASNSTPSGRATAVATSSASSDSTPAADLPAEVELSDSFPKDRVLLPSLARVTSTSAVSRGTYLIEVYVMDSPENVSTYFMDELPKHNWTNSLFSQSNGEYFLSFSGDNNDSVVIQIDQSDTPGYAKAMISVTTGTRA